MKKLLLLFLITTFNNYAQETYLLNKTTLLEWQGKASFSSYSPIGSLAVNKATMNIKNDTLSQLVVSVDMTTLSQENKQLEGHLRGDDFFDVQVYSTASFTLITPLSLASKNVVLEGLMTIRGKTNKESINATVSRKEQGWVVSFDHTFDRTTYGINYNSPSIFKRLKENAIDDNFTLKGSLEFIQK